MRKADFRTNHREFDTWVMWYGDFLHRVLGAKRVVRTKFEKMELLEALVLRCAARWEVLVTRDIIVSLNRDSTAYASELDLRLRKHLSVDECKAILMGRSYIDFRSVREIKSFGKKYLVDVLNPFSAISKNAAKKIDEFATMRNLLAHYSDAAWRSFRAFMAKRYQYQRVPEPGAFLIRPVRGDEYRWGVYLRAFLGASSDMLAKVT